MKISNFLWETDAIWEGIWNREKFWEEENTFKKLNFELIEYLLQRDYLKLEETELIVS